MNGFDSQVGVWISEGWVTTRVLRYARGRGGGGEDVVQDALAKGRKGGRAGRGRSNCP